MGTERCDTLATELLHELKRSARRWFAAFCIMVGLEVATIVGFVWYISLPVDDTTTTQTVESADNSNVRQVVGDYDEGDTDNEKDSQSNTQ